MNSIKLLRDGDHWTAFNPATGLKITASPAGQTLTKTAVPELLDISVTDHCSVGCSFCTPAGTLIATPQGEIPVETVITGQTVYSYDPRNRAVTTDTVTQVQSRVYHGNLITLNREKGQTLQLTPNHELLTLRGWVEAGSLLPEDQLLERRGSQEAVPVRAGHIGATLHGGEVFNFATEKHHSYFAAGLLVHNCYRDSKPGLPHATLDNLRIIAHAAAAAGVFEVACGGGEITEHPDFLEVLRVFSDAGLTTNFTTRRPQLVADLWKEISPLIGAFAVSVGSVTELERLATLCMDTGIPTGRVNLHLVLGTLQRRVYFALLEHAAAHGFRVTLLGYKTTGRGAQVPAIPYPWWLHGINAAQAAGLGLSIDTAVAAEYQDDLLAAGIDPRTFHTHEGHYSAFVDAVSMTLSPSSYEPWRESVPFAGDWLEQFRAFNRNGQPLTRAAENKTRT